MQTKKFENQNINFCSGYEHIKWPLSAGSGGTQEYRTDKFKQGVCTLSDGVCQLAHSRRTTTCYTDTHVSLQRKLGSMYTVIHSSIDCMLVSCVVCIVNCHNVWVCVSGHHEKSGGTHVCVYRVSVATRSVSPQCLYWGPKQLVLLNTTCSIYLWDESCYTPCTPLPQVCAELDYNIVLLYTSYSITLGVCWAGLVLLYTSCSITPGVCWVGLVLLYTSLILHYLRCVLRLPGIT